MKAKGKLTLRNVRTLERAKNAELHGNRYTRKCRSRAGSSGQTRHPDLVVFGLGLSILLSSVFTVSVRAIIYTISCCFRLLSIFRDQAVIDENLARLESIMARNE